MLLLYAFIFLRATTSALTNNCYSHNDSLSDKLQADLASAREQGASNPFNSLALAVKQEKEHINALDYSLCDSDAKGRARRACQIMKVLFPNRTISANSSSYVNEEQQPWSSTAWLPAACFVQMQSPVDVTAALRVVTHTQTMFAVRSRGHNPNPGFSSVDQTGVLLDLRSMNEVGVNADASVVSAGPGASWGDVYETLNPYNRSAVGGRHADVGTAGLILGGGIPYFAGLTGLPSSNVKSFQVVLANSTLVEASVEQNADLFYALKGGGPNYGIVTCVDLYTTALHKVWYSLAIYNASDSAAVFAGAARLHEFARTDPNLGFFVNVNANGLFAGLLYAGWSEWPTAYEPFRNLTPVITLANATNGTIFSLATAISTPDPDARRYGASVTHRFNPSLYDSTYNSYRSRAAQLNGSAVGGLAYTIQPISPNIASLQQRNGGSPLVLEPVDQDWIVVPVSWGSARDDAVAVGAADGLRGDVEQQAGQSGDVLDLVFMNDAASGQSPLRSYGEESLQRLKRIAQDYDPSAVFQELQYGGFLLSKA